jgi:hypothetical protein
MHEDKRLGVAIFDDILNLRESLGCCGIEHCIYFCVSFLIEVLHRSRRYRVSM